MSNEKQAVFSLLQQEDDVVHNNQYIQYRQFETSEEINEWQKGNQSKQPAKLFSAVELQRRIQKIRPHAQSPNLLNRSTKYDLKWGIIDFQKNTNFRIHRLDAPSNELLRSTNSRSKSKKADQRANSFNISNFSFDHINLRRLQLSAQKQQKYEMEKLKYITLMKRIQPKFELKAEQFFKQELHLFNPTPVRSFRGQKIKVLSPQKKRDFVL